MLETALSVSLRNLIERKSKRDNRTFTAYQLAKCLAVDRSLILRILSGEVPHPRIDTILKILDFFVQDGFKLSLDELVNGRVESEWVSEQIPEVVQLSTINVYSMNKRYAQCQRRTSVALPLNAAALQAFVNEESIAPFCPPGTLFIIDKEKSVEAGHLLAIDFLDKEEIIFYKCLTLTPFSLISMDDQVRFCVEDRNISVRVLGVVVRIHLPYQAPSVEE